MRWLHSNSLQVQLASRLAALFLLTTIILVAAFLYLSYDLAGSLSRGDLFDVSEELAEEIEDDGQIDNVDGLIARGWLREHTRYAIFDSRERVLVSSDVAFADNIAALEILSSGSESFRLDNFGTPPQNYLGVVNFERSEAGRVAVVVAEPEQTEQDILNGIMWDILYKAVWFVPVFIILSLLVGVWAIRRGLQPLRRTAQEAANIRPEALSARLGTANLPSEVYPLVSAVNGALDRLEAGFEQQRHFTANAAHELRTPLAIITGAIEGMSDNDRVYKLRQDVARMNRLVEQLLHVARLDSLAMDIGADVDLRAIALQVVEYMAPLAIAQGQNIELTGAATAVMTRGNAHAIEDCLRNLIENAIIHGRSEAPIEVRVRSDGSISVCDRGSGITEEDRKHIFERFWHRRSATGNGAGLGLSIVQEIMKLHNGTVSIENNPGGGSCFILRFKSATTTRPAPLP